MIDDIIAFHERFFPELRPAAKFSASPAAVKMRLDFMLEELEETAQALGYALLPTDAPERPNRVAYRFFRVSPAVDRPGVLDGLVDLLYVVLGTCWHLGLIEAVGEAWARVHAANMQKLRCEVPGKRGVIFDVRKPRGWQAPDLSDLVS